MQKIEWLDVDSLQPGYGGHGVEFYAGRIPEGTVLAFLHGYSWLHEPGSDVQVSIVRPSGDYPEELLGRLKGRIAVGLQAGEFDEQALGTEFSAWFNA